MQRDWKLVIHGGAGIIEKGRLSEELERSIRAALDHDLSSRRPPLTVH